MRKFRDVGVICLALVCSQGLAQTQKLSLTQVEKNLKTANAFDLDPAKGPRKKGGLMELKWRESRGDWAQCVALAEKLLPTAKDISPWVQRVRLNCALKEAEKNKKNMPMVRAFQSTKIGDLRQGPWRSMLADLWIQAGLQIAKVREKNPQGRRAILQTLLDQSDLLNKSQKAEAFYMLGETHEKGDPAQAVALWKQALEYNPISGLPARLEALEAKIKPAVIPPTTEKLVFDGGTPEGAESETDQEITHLLANDKRVDAARKMVELLNRFPNGQWARRDKDRIIQLLFLAIDKGNEVEAQKIRQVMSEAHAARRIEWVPLLHRRNDYQGAIYLADGLLKQESASPMMAPVLWAAGRSAHFIGEYGAAQRFFDRLIQYHAAADETFEALFRMGLLQLREGLHATSAKTFEKLIARQAGRWDLNARYWRIRALQTSDPERAKVESEELIRLYPFTYYGLRLKAEGADGIVEFPKSDRSPVENQPAEMWLTGKERAAWARFLKLSEEGWLLEAQKELSEMSSPKEPWSLLQWAKILAKAHQYPAAILLSARAIDREETLRHPRYLDFAFPKAYNQFIEAEAKKRQLDPVLVRSLIRQESAFGLTAVSSANALGLMQMIPPTAKEIAQELKLNVNIPDDLFRPEINVPMGSYYIAKMIRQYDGHIPMALAAYNAGPTRFNRWMRSRAETENLRGKPVTGWMDEMWYDELPWGETSFYIKAILRNALLDRLTAEGRVAVSPEFWSNLRVEAARIEPEKAKQR